MLWCGIFIPFPATVSGSDFWSLVWDVLAQHSYTPINTGGHTSCFVLAARLSFDVGDFQIDLEMRSYINFKVLQTCSWIFLYYLVQWIDKIMNNIDNEAVKEA